MKNNQVLAVWGSPSSGKTVLSAKIARYLASKEKTVVLVLCDFLCPMLPVLLPDIDPKDKSLGALLCKPDLDQEAILSNLVLPPNNDYLGLLGYKKGENANTYPQYVMEQAIDLLLLLRHRVDYVIVDCSSDLSDDDLSVVALRNADYVLRCGTADLKGLSFFDAQLPILAMDEAFGVEKHRKVLSLCKSYSPKKEISEAYGGMDFYLPYAQELELQFLEGRLFEPVKSIDAKNYIHEMKRIVKEAFNE